MSPADRRTREIKNEYVREFRNLDKVFACEFVGDGTGAVVGPFERAQQCFHSKQIVPLCAGWFGEVNKGIVVIRKELARLASAGEMSLSISPLANTDKKGAAVPNHVAAIQAGDKCCCYQGQLHAQTGSPPLRKRNDGGSHNRSNRTPLQQSNEALTERAGTVVLGPHP
eukprot:CAMPEP_0196152152 /NCGR_PEP_ID=MMETSP0910-20130528/34980_1 /TAXON_ID=49265 /ORGANISM="Thalassiosira rotula, Strain GSO102" /LENGTH=168 /DNA_ID=CAMNT_0041415685 /DNA_START=346 /DNA_END=851 /DNA_ORIENTATION=-